MRTHPWFGITRRLKLVILPLIAAILTAIFVALDKYYLTVLDPNPYVYCFISLWLGILSMVVFMLIMRIPLKKKHLIGVHLDPNFTGFILPKGKLLFLLLAAGACASVSSLCYFYLVGVSSPSTMIPFQRLVIVYLIALESISDRESPSMIETQSIVMIIAGIFLMSLTDLNFDIWTILIVLGPYNLAIMGFTIALQKAKRMIYNNRRNDALNMRFWSLAFNAVILSFILIPFMTPDFFTSLASVDATMVIITIISMMLSTIAYVAYIRALGVTKMSIVNAIMAFAIILGIPFTFIGNFFFPGAFGSLDYSPLFWVFKGIGALLIVLAIVVIAISQVKAYLLIYLDGPADPILKKLITLRGITTVSAVSGDLLLIAILKIRTLGKAYRTLVTDLEKIDGIKRVITLTNLKEWEKL
jgi:drug/metabolite transporter (DMT)-like permease